MIQTSVSSLRSTGFARQCAGAMACALLGLFPTVASAGLFSISPIRVDLDRQNKTDSITITNDEPERKITMQMKLYAWTQDALGNDVFTESDDLVYFPRIYSVESKGQRVVRLGLKQPAADPEKSYRLFFEEQPPAPEPGKASAQVTFVLRFGVPVFVRSENGKAMATIDTLEATSTGLAVIVRNSGNRNFQILSLAIHSAAGFDKEIIGGYVLAAGAKRIPALIPPALCKKLGTLQFTLKTDTLGTIEREFEWDASRCGKP